MKTPFLILKTVSTLVFGYCALNGDSLQAAEFLASDFPAKPDPGEHWVRIQWNNEDEVRRVLVILPDAYTPDHPQRLLLALHGAHGTAQGFRDNTQALVEEANANDTILVYPRGLRATDGQGGYVWNMFGRNGVVHDDIGFLSRLTGWLVQELAVDPARLFVTGFSNGAGMTQRLVAERPQWFAGAIPVAYTTGYETVDPTSGETIRVGLPEPSGPISTLLIRGGQDRKVPPHGGLTKEGFRMDTVGEQFSYWLHANQCDASDIETLQPNADITIRRTQACESGTAVYSVYSKSLGHQWPNAIGPGDLNGNRLIFQFIRSVDPPKRPEIKSVTLLSKQRLRFLFKGIHAQRYALVASSNLTDWETQMLGIPTSTDMVEADSVIATGDWQAIDTQVDDSAAGYFRLHDVREQEPDESVSPGSDAVPVVLDRLDPIPISAVFYQLTIVDPQLAPGPGPDFGSFEDAVDPQAAPGDQKPNSDPQPWFPNRNIDPDGQPDVNIGTPGNNGLTFWTPLFLGTPPPPPPGPNGD